jgi:hypothetical protein
MVIRRDRRRLRRALILALFLLVPALLSDLPVFSRTGHGSAAPAANSPALSGAPLALLQLDRGALGAERGHKHWHTAAGTEGGDAGDEDELLQNLVYLTHGEQRGGDNNPVSDGGDGWSFGGGGHGGGGSGGGGSGGGFGGAPFGGPGGNDPGSQFLPFDGGTPPGPGAKDKDGGDPPFLSSTLPPALPGIAAVPEPATWALFILGFGFIGTLLRRARDAQLVMSRSGRH